MPMMLTKTKNVHVDEGKYKAIVSGIDEKSGKHGNYYIWRFLVKNATEDGNPIEGKVKVTGLTSDRFSESSKVYKWLRACGIDVSGDKVDIEQAIKAKVRIKVVDDEDQDGRTWSKVERVLPRADDGNDEEDEEGAEEASEKKHKDKVKGKHKDEEDSDEAEDEEDEEEAPPKKKDKGKHKSEKHAKDVEEEPDEDDEEGSEDEDEDEAPPKKKHKEGKPAKKAKKDDDDDEEESDEMYNFDEEDDKEEEVNEE